MKRSCIRMGVLLCALFILVPSAYAQETEETKPHCIPEMDPLGDPDKNTQAMIDCADKTVLDSEGNPKKVRIFVPCGDYWVTKQVTFINVPLFTAFGPPLRGNVPCRANFFAHPKLLNQRIFFFYSVVGSVVSFIELDGNKEQRMRASMASNSEWPDACTWDDQRPANWEVQGTGIDVHDFASRNALCGSNMGILGVRIRIWNAVIEDAGFAEGEWPKRGAQFGDGLTSLYCESCEFFRIKFRNNSDIDFVLGGGGWNRVHDNECTHDKTYGFACFNWGQFEGERIHPRTRLSWSGNHEGTVAEKNTVFAVKDMLAHGFAIGKDVFEANPTGWLTDVGIIRYNRSFGAKHNYTLDGVHKVVMYGNLFQDARGTRTGAYSHCKKPYNFTAAHYGREARIQPDFESISVDGGVCKTER